MRSLFHTARNPSRVFVGVVWQLDYDSADTPRHYRDIEDEIRSRVGDSPADVAFATWWLKNTRHIEMSHLQATGPCWARHLAEGLWRGEAYHLQLDSHMRCRHNWDEYLVALHGVCVLRHGSCRPIITAYPLGYALPDIVPTDTRATVLVPQFFALWIVLIVSNKTSYCIKAPWKFDSDGMLRQKGRVLNYEARGKLNSSL